ncbi:uncharacterized protein VTP21DRAFT_1057 [Calcarisporiella thermophila]|uniref:uncharacterized protein n=1 Tax=Calcarisporiella thermophila TaxID=911321 RepID=UPI0037427EAB
MGSDQRRALKNRVYQRAYRERRSNYVKDMEQRLQLYEKGESRRLLDWQLFARRLHDENKQLRTLVKQMVHEWESRVDEPLPIAIPAFLEEKPVMPPPILVENELQPGSDRNELPNSALAAPFPMEASRSATLSVPMVPNKSNGENPSQKYFPLVAAPQPPPIAIPMVKEIVPKQMPVMESTGSQNNSSLAAIKAPCGSSSTCCGKPQGPLPWSIPLIPPEMQPNPICSPQKACGTASCSPSPAAHPLPNFTTPYSAARQVVAKECEPPPLPNFTPASGSILPAVSPPSSSATFSFSSPTSSSSSFSPPCSPSSCTRPIGNGSDTVAPANPAPVHLLPPLEHLPNVACADSMSDCHGSLFCRLLNYVACFANPRAGCSVEQILATQIFVTDPVTGELQMAMANDQTARSDSDDSDDEEYELVEACKPASQCCPGSACAPTSCGPTELAPCIPKKLDCKQAYEVLRSHPRFPEAALEWLCWALREKTVCSQEGPVVRISALKKVLSQLDLNDKPSTL